VNRYRISQTIGDQEVRFLAVCLQTGQSIGSTFEPAHTIARSFEQEGVQFDETLLVIHQID
jgi:hypothetical protein